MMVGDILSYKDTKVDKMVQLFLESGQVYASDMVQPCMTRCSIRVKLYVYCVVWLHFQCSIRLFAFICKTVSEPSAEH